MTSDFTPLEQYRFTVVTKVIDKEMKPGQAAKMLGVSTRQIRRLRIAVQDDGIVAVVHGLKGKQGNHHIDLSIKENALSAIHKNYTDFRPSFATEKLEENHSIHISHETTRLWMMQEGLWKSRKQKHIMYRSWRPRKEYFGELQQFDGSYHLWFENRLVDDSENPIEVCLLAVIDDATGKITKAAFAANEGVVAVFIFWKEYILNMGKPIGIYLDKFSTYKINHKAALDNQELMTQFERAMQNLGVTLITAHSPQAKGRIEKLFQTLQDRLVKEMRLANVNTIEDGNRFLEEVFLSKFNDRFTVIPTKGGDVHRELSKDDRKHLNRTFSIQSTRRINNDFTIQFKNHWYQLTEIQPITIRAKDTVLVEVWLDKTIHFSLQGLYLIYTVLPERPKRMKTNPTILTTHTLNWKPPLTHPWRKPFKPQS